MMRAEEVRMTEQQWQAATSPDEMLAFLAGRAGDRKLRLFACACCRQVWELLSDRSRSAVEVAERYADGKATERERAEARSLAVPRSHVGWAAYWAVSPRAAELAGRAGTAAVEACARSAMVGTAQAAAAWEAGRAAAAAEQARLLREMFGDPFRPVGVAPAWRTPTVLAVARRAYDRRDFAALPILADALEEAGCDDDALLGHLRGPGGHVRGCWAVDLLLGLS
jgi:hypothetical protein